MDIHDPVVLTQDIPEFGLTEGMQGAIVLVFNEPEPGYEVEFCDENGRTIAEVALTPEQIRPLDENGWEKVSGTIVDGR